jgi:hypothetical protein
MQRAGLLTRNALRDFLGIRRYPVASPSQECETLAQALTPPDLLRRPRLPQGDGWKG